MNVPNIYQIFDARAIAAYWKDVNANMKDPYFGATLFPSQKRTGLELAWIKGRNNLPVALQPSAFDTKAAVRDRMGVTELQTDMPFFRESMRVGEKDRQDIETLIAKNMEFAKPTIMRIFDDAKNLVDGALVQAERMRMALITTGKISIKSTAENGQLVAYDYNYDPSGTWATANSVELLSTSKWTTANKDTSNPLEDILKAIETLKTKHGVTPTTLLMNTNTFRGMMASTSIKKAINPLGATNIVLTPKKVKEFIEAEADVTIKLYDKMFKDEQGKDQKFYPDGYATLLPDNALGNTWFGTTPEEFDLLNGNVANASVSVVNTGVAVTTIKEPHPVNVMTVVSEIVLPSFERMDDIYVIKVGA